MINFNLLILILMVCQPLVNLEGDMFNICDVDGEYIQSIYVMSLIINIKIIKLALLIIINAFYCWKNWVKVLTPSVTSSVFHSFLDIT